MLLIFLGSFCMNQAFFKVSIITERSLFLWKHIVFFLLKFIIFDDNGIYFMWLSSCTEHGSIMILFILIRHHRIYFKLIIILIKLHSSFQRRNRLFHRMRNLFHFLILNRFIFLNNFSMFIITVFICPPPFLIFMLLMFRFLIFSFLRDILSLIRLWI